MGLFNFNINVPPAQATGASTPANPSQPVVLQLNEDSITITAEQAAGKTVAELFAQYGTDLGDVNRITRYIAAGQVVASDATVVPGTVYRGSVTSESKGSI